MSQNASTFAEPLESRRLLSVSYAWGIGGGCSGKAQANAVITGADGSVYLLGRFSGTLDVDPSANQHLLTAAGTSDMFFVKHTSNRKLIWAKTLGGANGQFFPTAMSLDPNGFLYIVGSYTGTVNFAAGTATSRGGEDAFILQVTAATGNSYTSTAFGGPYYDAIRCVEGSFGYPLVGGVFTKYIHFPQVEGIVNSAGKQDGFVFRYIYDADVNGYFTIGGSGYDAVNQIKRVSSTPLEMAIAGTMEATANFGRSAATDESVVLNSHGGKDAFYARYDGGFKNLFAQRYGGDGDECGDAMAVDGSGAYVAGSFVKPMLGLTSTGGSDVFVKKVNGQIRQIGSAADDAMGKLALDSTGRLIVTGRYGATLSFNNESILNEGKADVFMATYDDAFAPEQIIGVGGNFADDTTSLATSPGGVVYLAGSFQQRIDLAPGDISASIYGNDVGEYWLERLLVDLW